MSGTRHSMRPALDLDRHLRKNVNENDVGWTEPDEDGGGATWGGRPRVLVVWG